MNLHSDFQKAEFFFVGSFAFDDVRVKSPSFLVGILCVVSLVSSGLGPKA